jgi:hypothetical protein
LRTTPQNARKLIAAGHFRHVRPGKSRILVDPASVGEYLAGREVEPSRDPLAEKVAEFLAIAPKLTPAQLDDLRRILGPPPTAPAAEAPLAAPIVAAVNTARAAKREAGLAVAKQYTDAA